MLHAWGLTIIFSLSCGVSVEAGLWFWCISLGKKAGLLSKDLKEQLCVLAVPALLQNDQPFLEEAQQVSKSLSLRREHLHNLEGCSAANIARVCRLQRYSLDLYVNVFPLVLLWNLVEGVLAGSGHKLFKMHSSLYGTQKIINVQVEKSLGTNAALFTHTCMFPCMPLAYQMALLTSVSRLS